MAMRDQILRISELAKTREHYERAAEWFDTGVSDNLRTAASTEEELEKSVANFLLEHDKQTT